MIPVAANDLAFSSHAVLLTAFTLFQITIYDRGSQNVSRVTIVVVAAAWIAIAISVIIAIWTNNWLWLVSCFNMLQVFMTVIKYIPQAYMNFRRKSTSGFSIGNILLDLLGGIANYGQMMVQSIDQHSWVNFYGNVGKALLSLISIFFDLLFIVQHYVLYRVKTPRSHSTRLTVRHLGTNKNEFMEFDEAQGAIDSFRMHTSYLIYNASMFFSSVVQLQYHEKFGFGQMIPVAANDVAFSSHAVLLTAFTLFQITIYERGFQNVSWVTVVVVAAAWVAIAIGVIIAIWTNNWLWIVSCFNMLQVFMTVIKYIPQTRLTVRHLGTNKNEFMEFDEAQGAIDSFRMMIPVAANDVAFSSHAVLLTAFTLFQITIYERGFQNVSWVTVVIVSAAWVAIAIGVIIAIWTNNWLWIVSCFNMLQVFMTVIKYIPQAYMNFRRKSTIGFSIGNILLDLLGGIANYGQMMVQSIDQHSWVNFYGNVGKVLLSVISICFDLLFIVQHYVLYRIKTPRSHSVYQEAVVIMQA
ncbi:lysosomal cystine transporter [Artemisia annua]|uniref:Lysosomal cystine transporter n=1 Tax=Artemisia annua TaxID=35608 RepID=A0A2U1PF56_ARTAN|nr:lysosomal cystine transporter [Artemisia annua]